MHKATDRCPLVRLHVTHAQRFTRTKTTKQPPTIRKMLGKNVKYICSVIIARLMTHEVRFKLFINATTCFFIPFFTGSHACALTIVINLNVIA